MAIFRDSLGSCPIIKMVILYVSIVMVVYQRVMSGITSQSMNSHGYSGDIVMFKTQEIMGICHGNFMNILGKNMNNDDITLQYQNWDTYPLVI